MSFLPVSAANTASSASGLDWASAMGNWGTGGASIAAPEMLGQLPINLPGLAPGAVAQSWEPGFMDKMLGYRGTDGTQFSGWGGMAVGAASGLMNGFMGMKQLGIAKKSLAEGKRQFDLNFGAQRKLTNSRLEDRQTARVAAGGSAYTPVSAYMNKNGI